MLWIAIVNDSTGTPDIGHYDYTIGVNRRVLERGRIVEHQRKMGYEVLIHRLAADLAARRQARRPRRGGYSGDQQQ